MNLQGSSRRSTPERDIIFNQNISDLSFMSNDNKPDTPYLHPPIADNKIHISSVLKRRSILDKIFSEPKHKIPMRNAKPQKKDENKSWDMSFVDSSFSNKNTTINSNNNIESSNKPRNVMKFINKPKASCKTINNDDYSITATLQRQKQNLEKQKKKNVIIPKVSHRNKNNSTSISNCSFLTLSTQNSKKYHTISVDKVTKPNIKIKKNFDIAAISSSKRRNSIDVNKIKCDDGSHLHIMSFVRSVNKDTNSDKISFLSYPRMMTLISRSEEDKRIVFMFIPSNAYSHFGIENYEIKFVHSQTRKILYSFNILSVQFCEVSKKNEKIIKLIVNVNDNNEEFYLFSNSSAEAKTFATALNFAVNVSKCKAFTFTEKFCAGK